MLETKQDFAVWDEPKVQGVLGSGEGGFPCKSIYGIAITMEVCLRQKLRVYGQKSAKRIPFKKKKRR